MLLAIAWAGMPIDRSSFAWIASSMRLTQSLTDVKDLSQALDENIDDLWYRHSSLLRTKIDRLRRPVRMKPNEYRDRVYQLGRFSAATPLGTDADGANADEGGDDADAAQAKPEAEAAADDDEAQAGQAISSQLS